MAYMTPALLGANTTPLMSRPSGPVVVVQAHVLSLTATLGLPGHAPGVSAVAGRVPVPDGASGWQARGVLPPSAGFVSGAWQAAAFEAPKLFAATETKAPVPSGHRANAPAPKLFPSSVPASPAV